MKDMLFHSGVALQCAVVMIALAIMALRPPDRGAMLLVPLWGGRLADSINLARDADAGLLARGPLPGSIIVLGDRRRLDLVLAGRSFVVLAAPATGCGLDRPGGIA